MLIFVLLGIISPFVNCLNVKPVQPNANCSKSLDNLANALANFTSCSIKNSKPIKLCELCVFHYLDIVESYENITRLSDGDHKCISNYVNVDRLEIVKTLYGNGNDLWNRAKCYECFQTVNGKLTANLSNETVHFNELFKGFKSCIDRTDVNETTMCKICINNYTSLDNFYKSISNENEKIGVCMDIVDVMNETRGLWSKNCCKYRQHNELIFVFSTTAMVFTMVMFYVLTKICTDKKIPTVLQQSRFSNYLQNASSLRTRR